MVAAIIEAVQVPARRRLYVALFVLLLLGAAVARPVRIMSSPSDAPISDFDFFHAGARAALDGNMVQAYDENWFRAHQQRIYNRDLRGPWSYPPPFGLMVSPLGMVDRGLALLIFMQATLIAYLLTLRRLAGDWLPTALLLMSGPIVAVILFGQNGLLTGTLGGLACLGLAGRRRWAGIPLGLLIIKPHLALGFAVYVIASRDWRSFWTAGATAAAAAGLATLVFGLAVWPAFLAAASFASAKLPTGYFPLYRMVSTYAAARTLGAAHDGALVAQAVSAMLAVAAIILAQRRLPAAQAIGVTAFATLMISPYAFDYDLMIAGAGLALLLPDLARLGRPTERSALYTVFIATVCYGLARQMLHPTSQSLSLAAIGMWTCLLLIWRMLDRGRHPLATAAFGTEDTSARPQ